MLRGAILFGTIILAITACGSDSNESFESPYSHDGPWQDIAEKGCIEGMPAELHIEVDVDGTMRVLDIAFEGDHNDIRGQMRVDDDLVELRDWDPGTVRSRERLGRLEGFAEGAESSSYHVAIIIVDGSVHAMSVARYDGVDEGSGLRRAPSLWEIIVATGEFSTTGMSGAGSFADDDVARLRTECL